MFKIEVSFFDIKRLLQPYLALDSESNGCNFSSLASPGGEKKLFSIFFQNDVTSRPGRSNQIFLAQMKALKSSTILFFSLRSSDLSVF